MGERTTHEARVANYGGGTDLTLEIGSNDGVVFIALIAHDGATQQLRCSVESEDVPQIVRALEDAAKS